MPFLRFKANKMLYALVVVLFTILPFSAGQDVAAEPSKLYEVDEEMYNTYKDRLCKLLPFGGGTGELPPWSDTVTEDEIYELAFLSLGHDLASDAVAQIPGWLGWKRRIVDLMSYITQTTCNNPSLSSAYVSVSKNLFLYYLLKFEKSKNSTSSVPPTDGDDGKNLDKWNEILAAITTCSLEIEPIEISDNCGVYDKYQDHDGHLVPMTTHKEQFDVEMETTPHSGVDIIIDSAWWFFSITYARCYSYFYPNEDIILQLLQRFRDDVLADFAERWRGAGDLDDHFDLIYGPMEMKREFSNLRMCAGAAFEYEGLGGRELVRPITVMVDNQAIRNFKVSN